MINKDSKIAFGTITILCLLYSLPLIIWGGYYWDDVIRSTKGLYGWKENGRPLADFIFYTLNSGGVNSNFYPLPQILAVLIMAITIFLCWSRFLFDKGVIAVFCCIPLLTSPTFVENLSFRYDSFTMSLSVLLACLPSVLVLNKIKSMLLGVVCVVASLSLYQASITVFIIMSVLLFLYEAKNDEPKNSVLNVLVSLTSLLIGYFLYSKLIVPHTLNGSYNITHSQILDFHRADLFSKVYENFNIFYSFITKSSSRILLVSVIVPMFFSSIACLLIAKKNITKKGLYGYTASVLSVLSMPVLTLCIVGPVAFLEHPMFTPRVMIGYGAFMVCIFVLSAWYIPSRWTVVFSIPFLAMTIFCYVYTNALKSQNDYEGAITLSLINDISSVNSDKPLKLSISGRMPKSQQTLLAEKSYQIIHNLTPVLVNNDSRWALERFRQYGLIADMAPVEESSKLKDDLCNIARYRRGPFYDLYISDGTAIIDFTKKCR